MSTTITNGRENIATDVRENIAANTSPTTTGVKIYRCNVCAKVCKTQNAFNNHGTELCKRVNKLTILVDKMFDGYNELLIDKDTSVKEKEKLISQLCEEIKEKNETMAIQQKKIEELNQIVRAFKMAHVYLNISSQQSV
jgi:signal recognition particle GTPase